MLSAGRVRPSKIAALLGPLLLLAGPSQTPAQSTPTSDGRTAAGRPALPCELLAFAVPANPVPQGLDWRRSLDLLREEAGSWVARRGLRSRWRPGQDCTAGEGHPAGEERLDSEGSVFTVLPASVRGHRNSAYPRAALNGPLWEGRGASVLVGAGAALRAGRLSLAAYPLVAWQENRDFDFVPVTAAGFSPFGNPWHTGTIDMPQRFGDQAFWTLTPGQTFVGVDGGSFAAGVSNENLWWGPSLRHPLILGSAAPGFPHVFLGTSKPVGVGIGSVEGEVVWGILEESPYFDNRPGNDRRHFSGLVLAFSPGILPGVHLGVARAYHANIPDGGLPVREFFLDPFVDVGTTAEENQIVSIFARVAPPGSGFEAFVEWGRDDWWASWHDLLQEPDHSQGYSAGIQQVIRLGPRLGRLFWEVVQLGTSTSFRSGRGNVSFYTHSPVVQGHTQRGQLLGTPIGPGSDAQALGVDVLAARWSAGLLLERVRYQNDAYYQRWAFLHDFRGHDVELTAMLNGRVRWFGLDVGGVLGYSRRTSRGFLGLEQPRTEFRVDRNWSTGVELGWRP